MKSAPDQNPTTPEKVRRVARAIEDAIVVECHTWATKQLDYMAAAEAAIREAGNDTQRFHNDRANGPPRQPDRPEGMLGDGVSNDG